MSTQENILDELLPENEEVQYAKFWQRLLAMLIDGIIFAILQRALKFFFFGDYVYLLSAFSVLLYKPVMEYLYGATLGKMAMKIKVVSTDLIAPTIAQVILRNVFSILHQFIKLLFFSSPFALAQVYDFGFLPYKLPIESLAFTTLILIDALVLVFNRNNQALHDLIAKTIVVKS